jgi:hypothetical protein
MWRMFSFNHNNAFLKYLPGLIKSYNSTYHRSIKMTPKNVSKKNENQVFFNLFVLFENLEQFRALSWFDILT